MRRNGNAAVFTGFLASSTLVFFRNFTPPHLGYSSQLKKKGDRQEQPRPRSLGFHTKQGRSHDCPPPILARLSQL